METESAALETDTDSVVLADPGRLQRLFSNLFRNCVAHGSDLRPLRCSDSMEHSRWAAGQSGEAVENGGGVTVTLGDIVDASGFYVADDGPGIPEDERCAVFEAGYSTHLNAPARTRNVAISPPSTAGMSV